MVLHEQRPAAVSCNFRKPENRARAAFSLLVALLFIACQPTSEPTSPSPPETSAAASAPLAADASCGCESMTIEASAAADEYSHVYCLPEETGRDILGCVELENDTLPPQLQCAADSPFQCPLNAHVAPTEIKVGFAFEVFTQLKPDSDVSLCARGQYVQISRQRNGVLMAQKPADASPPAGTHTLGGFTFQSVIAPALIPYFGATVSDGDILLYGGDNYTELRDLERNIPENNELYWWDWPGAGPTLSGEKLLAEQDDFVSFVNGSDGSSCWCRFQITDSWNLADNTAAAITMVAGANCTVNS